VGELPARCRPEQEKSTVEDIQEKKLKDLTLLVYVLQAVGLFIGLTWIAAVIVNYVKRDEVRGSWLESHFDWQIKTFWVGLAGFIVGWITFFIFIGWLILVAVGVWGIYRIVKGWLALNDRQPLPSTLI
jgi:Predicted membrane protein